MGRNIKKISIVLVNFESLGGMRHYSDSLARILSKSFKLYYFNNYKSKIGDEKYLQFSKNLIKNYFLFVNLLNDLEKINPKVIHINGIVKLYVCPIYILLKKYKLIVTIHDGVPHEGESFFNRVTQRINLRFISKYSSKVIVHSEKIKHELPKYFIKDKVYVVPLVNFNHLADTDKQIKKDKRLNLLFFGRILPYKGLKYLVEAFKSLPKDKFKLIIAGEGRIDCDIPNQENIEVMNKFISDEEMKKLFSQADVLVLPYISASQSGVVYLSFAFNKPVISTKVGAIPEVVKNNFNGVLINPKLSKELTDAITLMSNKRFYNLLIKNIKNQNESGDLLIIKKLTSIYRS